MPPPPLNRQAMVQKIADARRVADLSIRRAAALAKVPPSTAQGWFEGRHLPTPALMPNFLALLDALGLASDPESRALWQEAIMQIRTGEVIEESPYVGLRSYTSSEAHLYVGRERAYTALIDACTARTSPIVVVVGDSGAGKSSLLAAGLIGKACAPGGPLEILAPITVTPEGVLDFIPTRARTLLVVDQFEETERMPPSRRDAVFDALAALPGSVTCVVALAASAFGFALRDERFAAHLGSPVLLGPLTTQEYTRIIEEPAERHGRRVSPDVVQLVLRDLHYYGIPAAGATLPLLSSALRRCWLHAQGTTISAADYLATGGIWSALRDEAESAYSRLDADQQALARRMFLSMVQVHDDHVIRRAVSVDGLTHEMRPIMDSFLGSRLLTVSDGHVRIAHDALLTHWTRLGEWIEDEKASLLIARRIHLAAQLWDEGGRPSEALMPIESELWSVWADNEDTPLLSSTENEFIQAGLALADAQRTANEITITRIRKRQNVAVFAAVLAGVLMMSTLGAFFQANHYRQNAEAATLTAQSRQTALIADELRELTPNTAGQLSVAAYSMAESVQTRSAVITSAGTPMPTRKVGPSGNTMVGYSPDRDIIVRGDSAGEISIWYGSELGSDPVRLTSGGNQLFTLSLATVEGRTLALVGGQQTAGIWDLTGTPSKIADYGVDTVAYSSAWHDGIVHIGTLHGEIRRIDLNDPQNPRVLEPLHLGEDIVVSALGVSENGILAGGRRDRIESFDLDGNRLRNLTVNGTALTISHSPDGTEALIGTASGQLSQWELTGGEPRLVNEATLPALVYSVLHLDERLIAAGTFGAIHEYDSELELVATYPEQTVVVSMADVGGDILAGATGGSTSLWEPADTTTVLTVPEDVSLHPIIDGDGVLLVGTSDGARILEKGDGGWDEIEVDAPPDGSTYTYYYAMSADGRILANQTTTGDLITLERVGDRYRSVDITGDQSTLVDIVLSETGTFLALGYRGEENYQLYKRSGSAWEFLVEIEAWPGSSAFDRHDTRFAAMSHAGTGTVVWDISSPVPVQIGEIRLHDDATPTAMSFAPDGNIAIGDNRGEVSIFSLEDPSEPVRVRLLRDARSSLSQVSYSHDGLRLLAATREGQLWAWKIKGEVTLDLQLTPGSEGVGGAAWFDGSVIMAAGNRTVAWPGDPDIAAETLCSRFGDRLTDNEWARLVPDVEPTNGCTPES